MVYWLQCYLVILLYLFSGSLLDDIVFHIVLVEIDSSVIKASISHVDKGIDAVLRSCKQFSVSIKTALNIRTDRIERYRLISGSKKSVIFLSK